jgi:zinc-ribbon family
MIVFGWGGGAPKDQGAVVPLTCPNCNNDTMFRYILARKWFRLYFIPLIPYDTKHFLLCPVCTSGKELTGQEVQRAKQMIELTSLWSGNQMSDERYLAAVQAFWAEDALPSPTPALPVEATQAPVGEAHPLSSLPPWGILSQPEDVPKPPWHESSKPGDGTP